MKQYSVSEFLLNGMFQQIRSNFEMLLEAGVPLQSVKDFANDLQNSIQKALQEAAVHTTLEMTKDLNLKDRNSKPNDKENPFR